MYYTFVVLIPQQKKTNGGKKLPYVSDVVTGSSASDGGLKN